MSEKQTNRAESLWAEHEKAMFRGTDPNVYRRTVAYREMRRAFFGGIYSALWYLGQIASAEPKLDPDEIAQNLDGLSNEASDVCKTMAMEDKTRNQAKKNIGKIILPDGRRNGS